MKRAPRRLPIVAGTAVIRHTRRLVGQTSVRPNLREDFVAARRTQRDIRAVLAQGYERRQGNNQSNESPYRTVTLSFTANSLIDQLVQELACELNLSRSAVVRQGVLLYHEKIMGRCHGEDPASAGGGRAMDHRARRRPANARG